MGRISFTGRWFGGMAMGSLLMLVEMGLAVCGLNWYPANHIRGVPFHSSVAPKALHSVYFRAGWASLA